MINKKILFMSLLLLILSVAAVSAADLDNDADLMGNEESFSLNSIEIQDSNELTTSAGTFDDLQAEINNAPEGSVLNLTRDYNGHKGSKIQLNKDLTIDGQGHMLNCLGESGCSAFYSSSGTITLKNLKIINGHNNNDNGGAIYITDSAQYTIENCTFEKNWADDNGGAIYNDVEKPLIINNCKFISNEADGSKSGCYGGAIYSVGYLYIDNSLFDSNVLDSSYSNHGGAIYCMGATFLTNSTFSNNFADDYGGAIYATKAMLSIKNCQFLSNKANDFDGGAIYSLGEVNVENSLFKDNWANKNGGAIYNFWNTVLTNCTFQSNKADDEDGGAIYSVRYINVFESIFKSNKAHTFGGAIYSESTINVDNSTFEDNVGSGGGAMYAEEVYVNSKQDVYQPFNSFFINNKANDDSGGAIFSLFDVRVLNSVFTGNSADTDAGAIFTVYDAYLFHCIFESNKADGADIFQCYGGAVRAEDDINIDNCTFKGNSAHDYGGAVYGDTIRINCDSPTQQFTSFFINNKAKDNDGGAVYAYYDFYASNAVFSGNTAYEDGGGCFLL